LKKRHNLIVHSNEKEEDRRKDNLKKYKLPNGGKINVSKN